MLGRLRHRVKRGSAVLDMPIPLSIQRDISYHQLELDNLGVLPIPRRLTIIEAAGLVVLSPVIFIMVLYLVSL